ncbi:hypothetical protein [Nonomuraea sp. NPDC049158]|uniref:hypothetical protein n=1 Tax=Nonomuraea sp. NPDC049158 TaxID=3155649 RepID=UPI0033FB13F6
MDVQQARNLVIDLGERIAELRFLIHDRDPLFSSAFREVLAAEGFRITATVAQTPRMNAICERVIGTLRRELLDRILILRERHLALARSRVPDSLQRTGRTSPGNNVPQTPHRGLLAR